MKGSIGVVGHAWRRVFSWPGREAGQTLTLPGGGAQTAALLRQGGASVAFTLPEGMKAEAVTLAKAPDGRLLAASAGDLSPGQDLAEPGGRADLTLVWDEGWGGIVPPSAGPVLWASDKAVPTPRAMEEMGRRCRLLLSGDGLRRMGAEISRGLSWERTALDLVRELGENPALSHLSLAGEILVLFGGEGAVSLTPEEDLSGSLFLLGGEEEGFLAGQAPGFSLPDLWGAMVYQAALQLAAGEALNPLSLLAAGRALWRTGYLPELLSLGLPFLTEKEEPDGRRFPIPGEPLPHWSVLEDSAEGSLYELAFAVAAGEMGRLEGYPRALAGAFAFYDRREIEALHAPGGLEGLGGLEGRALLLALDALPGFPGVNPTGAGDGAFILRRGVLLRHLLAERGAGHASLPADQLSALLLVPAYREGIASLAGALDFLRDGDGLLTADKAAVAALAPHVDGEAFLRLLNREALLDGKLEALAKAIHAHYRAISLENPRTDNPALQPWEALPDSLKKSNLRQAGSIRRKLRAIGCGYDAGDAPYPTVDAFAEGEIALLARLEHDLWLAERLGDGWRYGEKKDAARKTSPYLVPWEVLPQPVRELDREASANIIPLLASIGLRVYRTI